MKLAMFALIGMAAGAASATAVWQINQTIAHHNQAEHEMQNLLYAQTTPLTQGVPGDPNNLPPGMLPLDATPTPGVEVGPGSMRQTIMLKPGQQLPPLNRTAVGSMILVKSKETIKDTKDPVWELKLVDNKGNTLDTLRALVGRASKQNVDRNVSGSKSPLPKGIYAIDRRGIEAGPFGDPELGRGFWIPITPLFSTNRSALGLHQDPSWGKRNGESGTSGCIGLESSEATMKVVDWIKHYNISKLTVES